MLGFIKKDLLLVKNNFKSILIALVIYGLFIITNEMDASFILPFMMFMIVVSTFSYDDYNKWNTYAVTLPFGRENIIKGKYIATTILILGVSILGIMLSFVVYGIRGDFNLENTFSLCLGYLAAIIFMISIIYPIIFKYGSEKGRIAMFTFSFLIVAIAGIVSKFDIKISETFLNFMDNYGLFIILGIVVLMFVGSYFISLKIYKKKEL